MGSRGVVLNLNYTCSNHLQSLFLLPRLHAKSIKAESLGMCPEVVFSLRFTSSSTVQLRLKTIGLDTAAVLCGDGITCKNVFCRLNRYELLMG